MKKILLASALLLTTLLNAEVIDAKQLFNKKTVKVTQEEITISKSFYGVTKIDESSVLDVISRFDGYITNLYANKSYMSIKKGEPLYSIYSDDILSIQNELQIAKDFNKNIYQSNLLRLENLDISKAEQQRIKEGKLNSSGLTVSSSVNGFLPLYLTVQDIIKQFNRDVKVWNRTAKRSSNAVGIVTGKQIGRAHV